MTSTLFYPSKEIIQNANIKEYDMLYQFSIKEPELFWAKQAEKLEWFSPWNQVLDDSNKPFYKWFTGGKTNIVHNAIDRHLNTFRKNKLAFIWEGEPGDVKQYSYFDLHQEVNRFANILKSFDIEKGDIVTIYMPQIPELPISMLACAKIGAVHSVVYGGFSAEALSERIKAANSKLLITADGGFRKGQINDLKKIANIAMEQSPSIQTCITIQRTKQECMMYAKRDYWYHELLLDPSNNRICPTEKMDSEDMLFILYTSGTTGKPKGLVHTHGGYSVYTSTTHKAVFDIQETDRYWCAADPGWITGHSYIVYAPLMNGTTILLYEGAPAYPNPGRYWSMIEKYGINILYTSPTAIRGLMRFGDEWPTKYDLSALRLLGSVGEPINPEAWKWYYTTIGKENCPIMDTWWQTETGGFMITPLPITPLKPSSATKPFFGNQVDVVDENGNSLPSGKEGKLVIKNPWPGMARTILNSPERYINAYWSQFKEKEWYTPGDLAKKDENGYFSIIGRLDDVIKVSGYRLGTAEIESAVVSHPSVVEAAAITLPHEIKGNGIYIYAILKEGQIPSHLLEEEIKETVAKQIGKIAKPESITFTNTLPKTRSGKIMRRILKAKAQGNDIGDTSTLDS